MAINQGWYDQNEGRRFPFADDASVQDVDTGSILTDELLVDLVIIIPRTIDPGSVYISEVAGFGSGLVISFTADTGAGDEVIALATVPSTHERFTGYAISATAAGEGVGGRVVLGRNEVVASLSDQRFTFDQAAGQLAGVTVRPRLGGLDGLVIEDFAGNQYTLTGDIVLAAGNNLALSVDGGLETITLDADGGVVIDDRFAGNTDQAGRRPIQTVNGVGPDDDGNLDLIGTSCLQIATGVNRLTLDDTCAEPCCGCEELQRVQEANENLGSSQSELNAFLNTLESQIENLEQNFSRSNIPQVT